MQIGINSGTVLWCGDTSAICLGEGTGSDFVVKAMSLRVALSPFGRGAGLIVVAESPGQTNSLCPPRIAVTDNQCLMNWMLDSQASSLSGVFGDQVLGSLKWQSLLSTTSRFELHEGFEVQSYRGTQHEIELSWQDMLPPVHLDLVPSGAGACGHGVFAMLIEARKASVSINGTVLSGTPHRQRTFGGVFSSAYLTKSESWLLSERGDDRHVGC